MCVADAVPRRQIRDWPWMTWEGGSASHSFSTWFNLCPGTYATLTFAERAALGIIGIDLDTANSATAALRGGRPAGAGPRITSPDGQMKIRT